MSAAYENTSGQSAFFPDNVSPAPYCAPLPDGREMALWDKAAVDEGGASAIKLMFNAGEGALRCLKSAWAERKAGAAAEDASSPAKTPPLMGVKILLFMGKGNNGGDAAVVARLALREGAEALLCGLHPLPEDLASSQAAATLHLREALAAGARFFLLPSPDAPLPEEWERPDIIVDGLLGTGFTPPLRPEYAALIKRINNLSGKVISNRASFGGVAEARQAPCNVPWAQAGGANAAGFPRPLVLALDIPSGLTAADGAPSPLAVASDITVTFEAPKPGLLLPAAAPWLGKLLVHPVGIPLAVQKKYPPAFQILLPGCAHAGRGPWAMVHKGAAGKVLIIGGSPGLTGAPHLSALAALRGGAGLVRVACPSGLEALVKCNSPDIMTLPLGRGGERAPDDWQEEFAAELLLQVLTNDAVIVGPGLGLSSGSRAFLAALLTLCAKEKKLPPLLLDADALTILSGAPELAACLPSACVFTPHPGEAARLLKITAAEVEADRKGALARLMKLLPGAVLLKGAGTLIGQGEERYFLPFIEPNLAVGGSGDVLAGLIAAYLAQGATSLAATCAGAYIHGLCGHMLREIVPLRGNLASDIAGTIPRARALAARLPGHWLPSASGEGNFKGRAP